METTTYVVEITLTTEAGELPTIEAVEELIAAQMDGALDDPVENGGTGMFCSCVTVIKVEDY